MWHNTVSFSDFVGKTFTEIREYAEEIIFVDTEGNIYKMYHQQDCCENVYIEDINGDLQSLIGSEIIQAEENSEEGKCNSLGSETYTFYRMSTKNAFVVIRWIGSSNGYYSESVDLVKLS